MQFSHWPFRKDGTTRSSARWARYGLPLHVYSEYDVGPPPHVRNLPLRTKQLV